jgi:hypothetical protein
MSNPHSPVPLLSRFSGGVEIITIYENGRIILRHRRENGTLSILVQDVPIVAEIIQSSKAPNQWVAEIVKLPPVLAPFFSPNAVITLKRSPEKKVSDFMFTLSPCDAIQLEALFSEFSDFTLLINTNEVSCHRDRYKIFIAKKAKKPPHHNEL